MMDLVGKIVALMAKSGIHRKWSVEDISRLIVPPLVNSQFAIIEEDGELKAFATWAFLSPGAVEGFVSGERKLMPSDWTAGQSIWLTDVIAPYGHSGEICRKVRDTLIEQGHQGEPIYFRRNKGGERRYSEVVI